MEGLLWVVAMVGLLLALFALWRTIKVSGEVERLKRNEYYTDSKLKGVARQISDAVEPLRHHVSRIAVGGFVDKELIRSGRFYRDISVQEAQTLLRADNPADTSDIFFVDVRTPKEYAIKHIPQAKLVPIEELENRYKHEIPPETGKVLVYCARGDRSRLACDFLSRQGYDNVYNLFEGLEQWAGPTEGEDTRNLIQIHSKAQKR